MNDEITAREVRLVGLRGEQIGVVTADEARVRAADEGVDLVEIAPNAQPPVCRLMDYGKYRYEQAKRAREARKKQKRVQLKEVKVSARIDPHDYATKLAAIARFLGEGDKVKVVLVFKGREVTRQDRGRRLLERIVADTKAIASLERPISAEGHSLSLVLLPVGGAA